MIAINLPTTEIDDELSHLAQSLRDAVLQAEKLGLSETADVLRQAQAAAEKAVTSGREKSVN